MFAKDKTGFLLSHENALDCIYLHVHTLYGLWQMLFGHITLHCLEVQVYFMPGWGGQYKC